MFSLSLKKGVQTEFVPGVE